MDGDLLGEVLAVEKEIEAHLGEERLRAEKWLDEARAKAEAEAAAAEENFQEALKQTEKDAETEARARAGAMLEEARRLAGALGSLDDETLKGLLGPHLRAIMPERP